MTSVSANRPARIVLLDSAPTEMQAGVIVAALEQEGIKSTVTGMHTAGFRAEAPGWVQILVAEEDLPRAQTVLQEVFRDQTDIDWSQVDVGEAEEEPDRESTSWLTRPPFWHRIAGALILLILMVGVISELIAIVLRIILGRSADG